MGSYYMICRNEVENRLGLLGKRRKEWKRMGMNDSMELAEKGGLKKLRSWSEYNLMEMVRSLQIRQGFLHWGYQIVR